MSKISIHIKCIKILFKTFGISPVTLFALVTRPLRFLFSRFFYFFKKFITN